MKKQLNRFNQVVSQTLGRSEKSELLSEGLQHVEQRVDSMVNALEHTKKKLVESLRSRKSGSTKDEAKEKRLKLLEEQKLSQAVLNDARAIESSFSNGLLSDVMSIYGAALADIADETVDYELALERDVLEKLAKFSEDLKNINQQKDKLKKLVLDMDSAKTRLQTARKTGERAADERASEIQDELDSAQSKVENCKDNLATDLYTLASKEVDMAVLFKNLLNMQKAYHKNALSRLENAEPLVTQRINNYERRPVYGCPLADHIRYSRQEIALVLEVCCATLNALGLKDEGIFRISGNAIKVRKLKAAFDAGSVNISDYDCDPHSVAGALKSYLRELPDPLMTHNLYREWMAAVSQPNADARNNAVRAVLEKLPDCNYANLRYLIKFLAKLVENQQHTKMSPQNLAIVMAPNMIWSPTESESFGLNSAHGALVELLITNADLFFPGEISFTSKHVDAILDKNGGFLQNGQPPAALLVNVSASSDMDQTSPNKSGSVRRPGQQRKHVAPPPPPAPSTVSTPPKPNATPNGRSAPGVRLPLNVSSASGDPNSTCFDSSYPLEESFSSDEDHSNSPRKPASRTVMIDGQQITIAQNYHGGNNNDGSRQSVPPPVPVPPATGTMGHRKTNSLDRPLRPPRSAATEFVKDQSAVGTNSLERRPTTIASAGGCRPFPTEEELDECLGDFCESTGDEKNKIERATLPRPQPNRPPLPESFEKQKTVHEVNRRSQVGPTTVRVALSDESDENEPAVEEAAAGREKYDSSEHIYYDIPAVVASENRRTTPPAAQPPLPATRRFPVSPTGPKPEKGDVVSRVTVADECGPLAQKRESIMKLFDQQKNDVPPRPKPPVPSKPRSADSPDKDVTRL